ncbi:MAG: hypothetical protein ACXWPM_02490, partial [Bdellovibrionota bacterium]
MIPQETTPLILILCIALLMCTAVLAMAWGKRLPRQGAWLTWIGFAGLFVALGISGDSLVRNNLQPYYWLRGWVWPREELGAIAVGILQDFAGIGVSTLAAILSVLIVFNGALFTREPRSERVYSAIAFGAAGVALSWLAASPWLAFMGISLSVFGGFLSLGNRWDSNREADSAIRYAWERAWGLVFAMLGASILASTRRGLVWGSVELASPDSLSVNTAGAILLVLGLFVQTQSFPFFGRMVAVSETQPAIRVFASQVLPALAAFSILFRFEAQLRSVGVFPVFGWIALASAILTLLSGILQNSWRSGLSLFCAAGFSMSLAALALTSSQAGMEILLSTSLGSVVLALAGCAIECEGDAHSSLKQRATWA